MSGKGNYKGSAKAGFAMALAKARGLTTAAYPSKGSIHARWDEVPGATSYDLAWRRNGGRWTYTRVKGTGATITGLSAGKLYEVRVRARAGSEVGAWSKPSRRWPKKVASVKAVAGKSKGTIKVSWANDGAATGGYVAYAYTEKNGEIVARKAVAAGETSVTLSDLKSGEAYYIKVRPVRDASGTAYYGVQRYCEPTVAAK